MEKRYHLYTWQDGVPIYDVGGSQNKHDEGIYTESFCREFCRMMAGKHGFHVYAVEVK